MHEFDQRSQQFVGIERASSGEPLFDRSICALSSRKLVNLKCVRCTARPACMWKMAMRFAIILALLFKLFFCHFVRIYTSATANKYCPPPTISILLNTLRFILIHSLVLAGLHIVTIEASNFRTLEWKFVVLHLNWLCPLLLWFSDSVRLYYHIHQTNSFSFSFSKFSLEENFELFTCLTIKNVLFPIFSCVPYCYIIILLFYFSPILRCSALFIWDIDV